MISILHYGYSFIMLLGALYFYLLSKDPKGVPASEYLIAMVIPLWSGAAYLSIALGQGLFQYDDTTIYYARYIDWVISTPLLLAALALTAMFGGKKNLTLLFSLVALDVFMIITGFVADLSIGTTKYIWYSLGVIALIIILVITFGPLRRIAISNGTRLARHYTRVAIYLSVLWVCYPTAWLLGPSGLGLAQELTEVLVFIILPIFSKVGFSIVDLHGLRKLHQSSYVHN
ncbi:bacteriorhodopsin [Bacillus coahuilensis]|uniref:bacteriorhodopsin n=1 Tax=Bacillus coahuilensis TaxID=408580 RepID=UPI0007510C69|nr:bacteriorhodopsin [Bacillus coahuilensis]